MAVRGEERTFFRVYNVTKRDAAIQQIEASIKAFHESKFAVAITLAGAAEDMAAAKPGGIWESIRDGEGRPVEDTKKWVAKLNETRNWLKHDRPGQTRNLVAFEVGLAIIRAIDKWDPLTAAMTEFKELFLTSPIMIRPEDYGGVGVKLRK